MNNANIKSNIRKDKAAIKAAANRANRILAKYPELQKRFAAIMMKAKKQAQLGATPWFQKPVESFSGVGSWGYGVPGSGQSLLFADQTPLNGLGQSWWETALESDFTQDLIGFGKDIYTHKTIAADERKALELEIQQIQAKTAAMEQQEALARAMERSGTFTRSVGTTLQDNPMAIPLLLGLGGLLLFMRMK